MRTIKCVYTVKKANKQPSNIAKQYFFAWLNHVAAASKTLKHRINTHLNFLCEFSLQKWRSRKGYISLQTYRRQKHKTGTTSDHCQRCRPLLTPPLSFFSPFPGFSPELCEDFSHNFWPCTFGGMIYTWNIKGSNFHFLHELKGVLIIQ